jgi:hypothetical protein
LGESNRLEEKVEATKTRVVCETNGKPSGESSGYAVATTMGATVKPTTHINAGADVIKLPAERFGLGVGKIMHQFGITELPVATATGIEVGTLVLSTAMAMGVTMTVVAWGRLEETEIHKLIYDIDGHDLPLSSGVFISWDSAGRARLDAHRAEIMASLLATINSIRDQEQFQNIHSDGGKTV